MKRIVFGKREISSRKPTYVIAEVGINHNGRFDLAKKLVKEASQTGADAVKFQMFHSEELVSKKELPDAYDAFIRVELTVKQFQSLAKLSEKLGLNFLSSAFDFESVDLLLDMGVPAFKIASGEISNHPLLQYIANKGKPIIMSTGMSTLGEIEEAIDTIYTVGNKQLILLHCISVYPPKTENLNLRSIPFLEKTFKTLVGFSDHSSSIVLPSVAVALGARVIEKHLTIDKDLPGPDQSFSLEPHEFKVMIKNIRETERALGFYGKKVSENEKEVREIARKSIVAARDIPAGTKITRNMISLKRPAKGISPKFIDIVKGMIVTKDIEEDEAITWKKLK
jgi:N,N'-diacetyllegionaminate synthase